MCKVCIYNKEREKEGRKRMVEQKTVDKIEKVKTNILFTVYKEKVRLKMVAFQ